MSRCERTVTFDNDGRGVERLSSTGGRFAFGLYVRLQGTASNPIVAWLPTTSRKSPPRFAGRLDAGGDGKSVVRGTIRETRFEARQGWIWGSLAVLLLVITGGMTITAARGTSEAWWGVVVFGAGSLCFAAFAKTFSGDHQRAFDRDATELEDQLRAWASGAL